MDNKKFKRQKEIIKWQIKEDDYNNDYLEGYINALFDYILITDNQFGKLYKLFNEGDD